jgi:hypothetical protein
MKIQIAENRTNHPDSNNGLVRIFIERDFCYGLFVPESVIYQELTTEQREQYLKGKEHFDITVSSMVILAQNGWPKDIKYIDKAI